jgi:hypothetical protein
MYIDGLFSAGKYCGSDTYAIFRDLVEIMHILKPCIVYRWIFSAEKGVQ